MNKNIRENRVLNKEYFKLGIGFILSALTTPLLSSVDTAVVGSLSNPVYIGGVALGGTIFNTIYWILGFLRVSTSGYSAKAYGLKNEEEEVFSLIRPTIVSISMGVLFLIFQNPILKMAVYFYKSGDEISHYMSIYYNILICGAPFVLLNYTFLGWIMGRKQLKECLFLQLATNIINIILDLCFVKILNMDVAGVAYATLISQILTTCISLLIILRGKKKETFNIRKSVKNISFKKLMEKKALKEIAMVNLDLVIRTICMLTMTNLFVEKGSVNGEIVLAANSLLFQIQYLMAAFFDGFGNASSVFIGNAIGERKKKKVRWVITKSYKICAIISLFLCIVFYFFGNNIIQIYSNNHDVISTAKKYSIWILIYSLVINGGLVLFGLFTGATYTKPIRNSVLQATIIFLISYFTIIPLWGNHGLWLSFILFSLGRTIFLFLYIPKLKEKINSEIE